MSQPIFINSIAYNIGEVLPLREIADLMNRPALIERFEALGVTNTSVFSGSFPELVEPVLKELIAVECATEGIDAVILTSPTNIANSVEQECLLSILGGFGLDRTRFIYISGNECADLSVAIEYAATLLMTKGAENVLVVAVNDYRRFSARYSESLMIVFGDGAAGCLLSSKPGLYRVLGSWHETDWRVSQQRPDPRDQLNALVALAQKVLDRALTKSATDIEHYDAVVCANMNTYFCRFVAGILNLPIEKVFAANVGRIGHISDCDHLINLKSMYKNPAWPLTQGTKVLAVALGSRTVASIALETT